MRAKLARLLHRLAVHLDASVEPTVDLGDFDGGRYVKNLPASQIQWGIDYVTDRHGSGDMALTWYGERPGSWYGRGGEL